MTCHSANCFSIAWGQGNSPLVTSLPNSCYMTFDEAHMAFGQVSARARPRDKQGSVKRVVIFAFRSTNDEKRERSHCLGRFGQITVKI